MTPNVITLGRVLLAFVTVALFRHGFYANVAALTLLVITIWLDALDGYVARRTGQTTDAGAAFDIAADRIVENVYWIFFAAVGLISFWIPLIVIARGGLTDFLRTIAFTQGQTAFGEKTMMTSWWGKMLTGSRWSRAAYGIVKCAAFFALGARLVIDEAHEWKAMLAVSVVQGLRLSALILVIAAVVFCVVRGVPVIIEGLRFFRKTPALSIQ